jgi:glutathione synthase/RimK-type ligase-like ATP-grasp enzyme
MPGHVLLVTESRYERVDEPDWYVSQILEDDSLLAEALGRRGFTSERVDWARSDVDWSGSDGAVLRTTWDYFERLPEFSAWLDRAEAQTRVLNTPDILKWNVDKHYLRDLAARNVAVVPTRFIEVGEGVNLHRLLDELESDEAVFKPVVSGAARHTHRVRRETAAEHDDLLRRLVEAEAMMIQPFQHAILEHGEVTLMMFAGEYSHAIVKRAKPGDFRVQDDHGGTVHEYDPTPAEIALAVAAMQACDQMPVYGRVDMVHDADGSPQVMELELVEPELWLREHPASADAFADAIASALRLSS